ncbi:unnamed protein product [Discosporangium mesarthrocarpum]
MKYAVPAPVLTTLSVVGGELKFPVRRVYCVGQNYRAHTIEVGGDPKSNLPFFFSKPPNAIVDVSFPEATITYPSKTVHLEHEVELVVAIGRGGYNIPEASSLSHVYGYAAGVDLTRRDLQSTAKFLGRPWDCSKGFDASGPVGLVTPAAMVDRAALLSGSGARIMMSVNGRMRQDSNIGEMTWTVPQMLSRLSELFTLAPGDLLFTGTPSGVGPLLPGDECMAMVEGLPTCQFTVSPPLSPTPSPLPSKCE